EPADDDRPAGAATDQATFARRAGDHALVGKRDEDGERGAAARRGRLHPEAQPEGRGVEIAGGRAGRGGRHRTRGRGDRPVMWGGRTSCQLERRRQIAAMLLEAIREYNHAVPFRPYVIRT